MKTPSFKPSYPTRKEAVAAALAFLNLLKRPAGWKPYIHCSEPLPQHRKTAVWYPSLINGPMHLMYSAYGGHPTYWTLLDDQLPGRGSGSPLWSGNGVHHSTPDKAIAERVRCAVKVFDRFRQVEAAIMPLVAKM